MKVSEQVWWLEQVHKRSGRYYGLCRKTDLATSDYAVVHAGYLSTVREK